MRIGVDAQLALGTATGIGEYVAGLVPALRACGAEVVSLARPGLDPWRFDRRVLWDQLFLPLAAARERLDVLHCAAGTMPLWSPQPVVTTVHDVAWLRVQGHTRAYARAYFGRFQLARYRHARRIVVDSNFSRGELLDVAAFDPDRVDVVYPGIAADMLAIERRPQEAPVALAVGTVERRKNLAVLIRALPAVPALHLVSVGPHTPYAAECAELARACG
ncbi:MAG: glycosyltransferase, partial [Candidatus Eremiobacteraeota bacterium]|nr:glycosyltransferase [Candidatus Eremiobacteraeota bacterium]MBV9409291.1 glycosyltransferase [Candidatus Eremiobacteraeota bacterium]